MIITLDISGGIGGLVKHAALELTQLSPELSDKLTSTLDKGLFELAEKSVPSPNLVDSQVYSLKIERGAGEAPQLQFLFNESQASDELLDLLDELQNYMNQGLKT